MHRDGWYLARGKYHDLEVEVWVHTSEVTTREDFRRAIAQVGRALIHQRKEG